MVVTTKEAQKGMNMEDKLFISQILSPSFIMPKHSPATKSIITQTFKWEDTQAYNTADLLFVINK